MYSNVNTNVIENKSTITMYSLYILELCHNTWNSTMRHFFESIHRNVIIHNYIQPQCSLDCYVNRFAHLISLHIRNALEDHLGDLALCNLHLYRH